MMPRHRGDIPSPHELTDARGRPMERRTKTIRRVVRTGRYSQDLLSIKPGQPHSPRMVQPRRTATGGDQVEHGAHAAGTGTPKGKRPRGEADRRWDDAKVHGAGDRSRTSLGGVSQQRWHEWQACDSCRHAAKPRDLEGRDASRDLFLHNHRNRVGKNGDETERDAGIGARPGPRSRKPHDRGASEGEHTTGEQPPRITPRGERRRPGGRSTAGRYR